MITSKKWRLIRPSRQGAEQSLLSNFLSFSLFLLLAAPCRLAAQSVEAKGKQSDSSTQLSSEAPHVTLRLTETVSSATARVGQRVALEVVNPVQVGGKGKIPSTP